MSLSVDKMSLGRCNVVEFHRNAGEVSVIFWQDTVLVYTARTWAEKGDRSSTNPWWPYQYCARLRIDLLHTLSFQFYFYHQPTKKTKQNENMESDASRYLYMDDERLYFISYEVLLDSWPSSLFFLAQCEFEVFLLKGFFGWFGNWIYRHIDGQMEKRAPQGVLVRNPKIYNLEPHCIITKS